MIALSAAKVGKIHAASVSPVPVILRLGESVTSTSCENPFNWTAPPAWPLVQPAPVRSVPLLPLPLLSPATVPVPSSKLHFATGPEADAALVVTGSALDSAELFPAASNADTV